MGASISSEIGSVEDWCSPKIVKADNIHNAEGEKIVDNNLPVKIWTGTRQVIRQLIETRCCPALIQQGQGTIGIKVSGSKSGFLTYVSKVYPGSAAEPYKQVGFRC